MRYTGTDLLDSFVVHLPMDADTDISRLAELALSNPSKSFRVLMAVRDAIMAWFGVKTSAEMRSASDGLPRLDFFPILASSNHGKESPRWARARVL